MAITLPAIILLYDVSLRNEVDRQSFSLQLILNTIKDRGLFYGGYMAVSLLYLSIRFFVLYHPQESIKPFYGNLFERIIFLPAHIFSFIKLAFFPVNLTADYVFSYPHHFFAASNLIGFLFVAGLAVGSVFIFKYSRGIFFGIWWFFITLFPVYNIIPIYNPFAERFLYIPLIGFCMLVAMAFNNLMNKRLSETVPVKVLSSVAIIALLSFYATITIPRNRDWKDSLTLWSKTVITSPNSSIAHGSLGRAYQDLGRLEEAIREYKKAIEIFPDNYKAYYNLGVLYDRQGALKEAVANYKSYDCHKSGIHQCAFQSWQYLSQPGLIGRGDTSISQRNGIRPRRFRSPQQSRCGLCQAGEIGSSDRTMGKSPGDGSTEQKRGG